MVNKEQHEDLLDTLQAGFSVKSRQFKTILTILAALLALCIGEIAARLCLPDPLKIRFVQAPNLDLRLRSEQSRPLHEHLTNSLSEVDRLFIPTRTGMRLRANSTVAVQDWGPAKTSVVLRTNSMGYRGPEVGAKRGTRILFLGDSVTFGLYVGEEETFVRLVADLAAKKGHDWETINAAVPGIGLKSEMAILRETGLSLRPDVVVLCSFLNDWEDSPGFFLPRLHPLFQKSRLLYYAIALPLRRFVLASSRMLRDEGKMQGALFRQVDFTRWQREVAKDFPPGPGDYRKDPPAFNQLIQDEFPFWGVAWSEDAWNSMRPYLRDLQELSREHGFKLVMLCFPVRYQIDASYDYEFPQQMFRKVTTDLNIPALDPLPVLKQSGVTSGEELMYDRAHLTPRGNELVARAIAEFLEGNER